jgi:hypothetical protein
MMKKVRIKRRPKKKGRERDGKDYNERKSKESSHK